MATSNLPGKDTHNADSIIGWIIVAVWTICGLLASWLVFYKFMTGIE